jgi:hypothetical protein
MSDFVAGTVFSLVAVILGVAIALATTATEHAYFIAARAGNILAIALISYSLVAALWARKYPPLGKTISAGAIVAAAVVSIIIINFWFVYLETKDTPKLFAGNDTDPAHLTCRMPPDGAMKIFIGSNMAWSTRFPHTVLRMGGTDMLVVDRDADGSLTIKTLRVFDANGELLARFDDGIIWSNVEIRTARPDKSTLAIFDKADEEIMRIRFMNPQSLKITGTFFRPPAVVRITDFRLLINGGQMSGNCMENSVADIAVQ